MRVTAKKLEERKNGHDYHQELQATYEALRQRVRGKDSVIELSIAAMLAGGHVLLEGPPGTGKTSLAHGLATAVNGVFKRIQMTSDMLPSDVVGFLRIRPGSSEFEFRRGPVFSNVLLADELNRSSPKTQAALLESMAEGTVTVDGTSYDLPDPFFVISTQNPMEFQGVYPLNESQLDRFMILLRLDAPEKSDELRIYEGAEGFGTPRALKPLLTTDDVVAIRREVAAIHTEATVYEYCVDLVRATRFLPEVSCGVSVRGGLQLIAMARALAYLRGREFVTPKEVKDAAVPALAHRLCFADGTHDHAQKVAVILRLLEKIQAPR
ncbi:MAG TPA: MoxR family ATPase [Bdellovibrionota bacterium]|nr:MoxR family ATPase [Bdellovibrionota bacterium]